MYHLKTTNLCAIVNDWNFHCFHQSYRRNLLLWALLLILYRVPRPSYVCIVALLFEALQSKLNGGKVAKLNARKWCVSNMSFFIFFSLKIFLNCKKNFLWQFFKYFLIQGKHISAIFQKVITIINFIFLFATLCNFWH